MNQLSQQYRNHIQSIIDKPLVAPYQAFNGRILNEIQCDQLNGYLDALKASLHFSDKEKCEGILNLKHQTFVSMINGAH